MLLAVSFSSSKRVWQRRSDPYVAILPGITSSSCSGQSGSGTPTTAGKDMTPSRAERARQPTLPRRSRPLHLPPAQLVVSLRAVLAQVARHQLVVIDPRRHNQVKPCSSSGRSLRRCRNIWRGLRRSEIFTLPRCVPHPTRWSQSPSVDDKPSHIRAFVPPI